VSIIVTANLTLNGRISANAQAQVYDYQGNVTEVINSGAGGSVSQRGEERREEERETGQEGEEEKREEGGERRRGRERY
jgi:hypothetical protein